jgi:hypothetical protein
MEMRKSTQTLSLAADKTDADYCNSLKHEYKEVDRVPGQEKEEAEQVFADYKLLALL